MPTITFEVPDGALSAFRLSPTEFGKEMRVAAALLWYSRGEPHPIESCGYRWDESRTPSTSSRIGGFPWCR
jgi:hypothetical protein